MTSSTDYIKSTKYQLPIKTKWNSQLDTLATKQLRSIPCNFRKKDRKLVRYADIFMENGLRVQLDGSDLRFSLLWALLCLSISSHFPEWRGMCPPVPNASSTTCHSLLKKYAILNSITAMNYLIEDKIINNLSRLLIWWSQGPCLTHLQIQVSTVLILLAASNWYGRFIKFYIHVSHTYNVLIQLSLKRTVTITAASSNITG